MLYLVHWTIPMENRDKVIQRFLQTGGLPPANVKLVGRWHAMGHMMGFGLAEAENPLDLQRWMLQWTDLMNLQVHPAMTDAEYAPLLVQQMEAATSVSP
ncbi:DUF3303 domain-containing protein [Pseudomonas sp. QE6]|uniref:DUF3303 domain-containing protein n=1 Tax=Pseudomonas sp. QE6 TaxID=3242491 RepID=UPI003528323E